MVPSKSNYVSVIDTPVLFSRGAEQHNSSTVRTSVQRSNQQDAELFIPSHTNKLENAPWTALGIGFFFLFVFKSISTGHSAWVVEKNSVFQQHSGSFHHCTKNIFCKQVSWITVCVKRRGQRRTVWALYRLLSHPNSCRCQGQMPVCSQHTWDQILTWTKWSQFPESARHCTTLPLVRSWP